MPNVVNQLIENKVLIVRDISLITSFTAHILLLCIYRMDVFKWRHQK